MAGDQLIGKQAGNYRLVERLGASGMGTVYNAVHVAIGSKVAIKVLHATAATDRGLQERFNLEAQAGRTNEGGNEQSIADQTAADTTPTTTTPTTTTERTSTTTPQSPTTTTPLTDNPIPGAATAPAPATSTNHQRTKGGSTNDRREKIKQRVQHQQSERDGEM